MLFYSLPVPDLASTSFERVGASGTHVGDEFTCSGEDRRSRFWGVSRRGTTTRCNVFFLVSSVRSRNRHCYTTARHRMGRLHQQSAMSTSVNGFDAAGYEIARFITVVFIANIIYVHVAGSHTHLYDVTNIFTIVFSGLNYSLDWLNV